MAHGHSLREEFDAEPGTFLECLQTELRWDAAAFERLTMGMETACLGYAGAEDLPRWLVAGFWYLADTVPALVETPTFIQRHPGPYYRNACRRLRDLTSWLVYGYPL